LNTRGVAAKRTILPMIITRGVSVFALGRLPARPRARAGFLKTICTDPADLLVNTLGNYVRYRDGKTNKEWIPVEYLPDKDERLAKPRKI
jgi:hypothetical protein